jgi:hypothetical protein
MHVASNDNMEIARIWNYEKAPLELRKVAQLRYDYCMNRKRLGFSSIIPISKEAARRENMG